MRRKTLMRKMKEKRMIKDLMKDKKRKKVRMRKRVCLRLIKASNCTNKQG